MSKWEELSMAEKAEMMKVAVRQGITNLSDIKQKYNEFAEGGSKEEEEEVNTNSYSVGNLVNALYQNNPKEKYLGEPEHHYDFTQSEEWANAHGYYSDARGHRDDRVKKPAHPSHSSRGVWDGDKFVLTDFGMQNPNYTLFGLNDGGQDPQATLIYNNSVVLPELTVTPNENYFFNPYDNIELHYAKGGKIHIKPSHRGRLTELKKRTGKTEAELYNDGNPAHKKMVVFARNSRKWKHGLGGNLFDGNSQPTQKMKISKPYYSYDENGRKIDDTLNYNISFPEVVIIPDSKKSPAERNENERYRQRTQKDYDEQKGRDYTERQITKSQKEWDNSLEKALLDYGQTAATEIGIGADMVSGLPIYSSLKGASTLSRAETPIDYVEGGLWLTPILGSAYNTTKPVITQAIDNALAQAQQVGRGIGSPFGFAENIYNYAKRKPIPFAEKQAAAQRMENLIHSPEYIERQKAAGLSDSEIVDFQSMISRRLNGGNFPAYTMKRNTNGLSLTLPKPFGGIYMREGIPYSDFLNSFDHEVAHYSTVNFGKTDNQLLKLLNRENPTVIEKIMGYNINKVPYRPETDAFKVRTARGLDPHTDKLNYYRDEQEVRSNAYAILQEAQRRGITVDDLVDHYTMQSTGEIFGFAPAPLRYLNYAYTPENIKKFTKGFLSFTAPLTFGIKYMNQDAK